MQILRFLLFPFSILYGLITSVRTWFYKTGIFKRTRFSIPVIVVGNLSVGGTGKTPMVEYLINLLQDKYKLATLSRGYKRQTKGFVLANKNTLMPEIGDEPFQYHSKFEKIKVAVDSNRVNGLENILQQSPTTQVAVLDDAYQHLAIQGGLYILLTTYNQPYYKDFLLPTGNLRETQKATKRAQIVIVTKCPKDLSKENQASIRKKLNLAPGQLSFFTYIEFSKIAKNKTSSICLEDFKKFDFIMVAGIAKPQSFFDHVKKPNTVCMVFKDHHNFTPKDIEQILQNAKDKKIITTEKDYMRLQNLIPCEQLYYLPIQTSFISQGQEFDKTILHYVGTSTTNC
ncbi:tetraacyldisaccharide 4'-kinase [Myroides sp. LJL119]